MSELKAIDMIVNDDYKTKVYFKSEADKVIAHQKYKRCLDNAWQCKKLIYVYTVNACNHRGWNIERYYDKKAELYRKWHKRWLKIAEKFKEAK